MQSMRNATQFFIPFLFLLASYLRVFLQFFLFLFICIQILYSYHLLSISHPKTRMRDVIPDHLVDRAEMKMRELSLRNSDCFICLCKIVSQQICIIHHFLILRNSAHFLCLHINYVIDFSIYRNTT